MKIYATTDTHFGHTMLVTSKYREAEYESVILDAMSKLHGDVFIHTGDIAISNEKDWNLLCIKALGGFKKKILVRGNHDSRSYNWYLDCGWDMVCEFMQMRIEGKEVLFSHMPLLVEDVTPTLYHKPIVNFHGHLHGNGKYSHRRVEGYGDTTFNYDIAPDTHDMKPVSINKLLQDITNNSNTHEAS